LDRGEVVVVDDREHPFRVDRGDLSGLRVRGRRPCRARAFWRTPEVLPQRGTTLPSDLGASRRGGQARAGAERCPGGVPMAPPEPAWPHGYNRNSAIEPLLWAPPSSAVPTISGAP